MKLEAYREAGKELSQRLNLPTSPVAVTYVKKEEDILASCKDALPDKIRKLHDDLTAKLAAWQEQKKGLDPKNNSDAMTLMLEAGEIAVRFDDLYWRIREQVVLTTVK